MPTITTTVTVITQEEVAVLDDVAGIEEAIKSFNDAKKMIKYFEGLKEAAEKKLRAAMGDAKTGTLNGVERLSISSRVRTGTDRESLKTAFPEAYELTLTETPYTVLLTK